ncbi:MAG: alpha/beta fold hydrolase [Trebonia sp.]
MTEPKTRTLDAPGAVLYYDVRSAGESELPVLLIIGSPMGADGFVTLAGHFTDRTVVTYDPRGAGRSPRTDGAFKNSVEEHADDLDRLITALDAGPTDVFASSGGAVNGLALVARHPGQVRTLVAHEPPALSELPDREYALAAADDIYDTYQRSGFGPAMAKFIALVGEQGPITAEYAKRPAPDPAVFTALRATATRIVIGVGEESGEAAAGRAGTEVARRLGLTPVIFPGGHDGFLGGEYGRVAKPDEFAATLRDVLSGR